MIKTFIISVMIFVSAGWQAMAGTALFDTANKAYAEGQYQSALDSYVQLVENGESNAALFYNLGNTYYKLNKIGTALLWLERARALSPSDPDIIKNIETIRKNAGIIVNEEPVVDRYLSFLDLDTSVVFIMSMIVVLSLAILLRNVLISFAPWIFSKTFGAAYISVVLLLSLWIFYQYKAIYRAVVVADDAPLLISPYEKADTAGTIKDGTFVRVVKIHGNFKKIKSDAGHQGWMSDKDVMLIISR